MYEFHGNKKYYFDMTRQVTVGHILPYIQQNWVFPQGMQVLEIGCGEAGVLKAFTDLGYHCTGIELDENRLEYAREFMLWFDHFKRCDWAYSGSGEIHAAIASIFEARWGYILCISALDDAIRRSPAGIAEKVGE